MASTRQLARQIFTEALAATTVSSACAATLRLDDQTLHAGTHSFDLRRFTNIQILSIGKAGATLFDAVRPLLPPQIPTRSIISAPSAPTHLATTDQYFPGGHPLPNAASLAAAKAALDLLATATAQTFVLFLISGGASAMFEQPIDPTVTLHDLTHLNRQLIASGAAIRDINTVRKHLSAVKGGRLAAAAPTSTCLSLFISDVPANALDALASGPTLPDPTTIDQTRAILCTFLPHYAAPTLHETPKPNNPIFRNTHHVVLLDNNALLAAAQQSAERLGFTITLDNTCDDWPYNRAAQYLLDRSAALAAQHPKSCLLSGGEVTVQLPATHGLGGRNQHLALFAAQRLPPTTTLLSAGSDGIDGNSLAAGAVVDATTWPRAYASGLDPAHALAAYNTAPLLETLLATLSSQAIQVIILETFASCSRAHPEYTRPPVEPPRILKKVTPSRRNISSRIHFAAQTDIGRVRSNNEDSFGCDENSGLYLVCDGMGGAAGGEIASHLAFTTALESFAAQSVHTASASDLEDHLRAAITAANTAVYREGRGDEHHNMGTTLVAAAIAANTLVVGNVGDSRAYMLQQHRGWHQITSDHSYINELVRLGTIREEDMHAPELQRFGAIITRAIGAAEDVHPEFFSFELHDGDTVLLCSDGLTRYLDATDFDRLIDPSGLEASCHRLIDAANNLGGIDNITCLLLRYAESEH